MDFIIINIIIIVALLLVKLRSTTVVRGFVAPQNKSLFFCGMTNRALKII